jgi:hypothetical protein
MSDDFNYLVRVQGSNLDGTKKIVPNLCGARAPHSLLSTLDGRSKFTIKVTFDTNTEMERDNWLKIISFTSEENG